MNKITPSPHPDSTCRPPNHNPLVADERWETLSNVHDAIATLQEMTIMPLGGELVLSEAATSGMYSHIQSVSAPHAL